MRFAVVFLSFFMALANPVPMYAQTLGIDTALSPHKKDPNACVSAALQYAQEHKSAAPKIAARAMQICPPGTTAALAAGFANAFPNTIDAIAAEMAATRPEDVGIIVVSAVSSFPANQRQATFERIVTAVKARVPGIANQPAYSAISLPGEPAIPGLPVPSVGLFGFDVISPT